MKKVFSSHDKSEIEKKIEVEQETLSALSASIETAKRDLEILAKAKSTLEAGVLVASEKETETRKRYEAVQGDIVVALERLAVARKNVAQVEQTLLTLRNQEQDIVDTIEERWSDVRKIDSEIDALMVKRGELTAENKRISDEIALHQVQEGKMREAMLERNREITARNEELSAIEGNIMGKNARMGQLYGQIAEFERIAEVARAKKNTELDEMDKAIAERSAVCTHLVHEKAQLEHIIEKRNRAEKETLDFVASKERLMAVIAEQKQYLERLKEDTSIKHELGL